ncbi:MAG TPA: D-alanyl-D-alanine carboxypeptidase/D-alanyl-D-alanine-endopeptidase [Phycisphaerae bacterium]|nr:D-alanyl-D-alanine carboxypeptidase/D-alanyl-D-alanine-endopeptidase [Phycisphaerae bacterium]
MASSPIASSSRTRNTAGILLGALSLCLPAYAFAGADAVGARLQQILTHLPQPGVRCSARIVDLDTGRNLCDIDPTTPLLPASNAKLFVLATALDRLGPDFAFRTRLALSGRDLVLIGDGDPSLGDVAMAEALGVPAGQTFAEWAGALRARGVTAIGGDLIIDESIFDNVFTHPTWEPGDLKKWYAAPVGALNYNDNCVDITIWPGPGAGAVPGWESVPKTDLIEIVFRNRSSRNGDPVIDRPKPELTFVVTGTPAKRWPFPPIPAPDPGFLTAGALRTALADQGISIAGKIVRQRVRLADGSLPAGCQLLAEHVTPLPPILARTGKRSQNLFAECLMKRTGYEWAKRQGADPQGTWETGRTAIEAFLAQCGRSANTAAVVDGSGLSRDNRASAADFVAVLQHMYRHPYRQIFAGSLSEAGNDGSLTKRLKDLPGTVYAKTGYLSGVRTLSGYAVTPSGRWRAFSVLFNGIKGGAAPFNKVHDEICRVLVTDPADAAP